MNPSLGPLPDENPDDLIRGYLDDVLGPAQVADLNNRLLQSASLRRRFALNLVQDLHLVELGREAAAIREQEGSALSPQLARIPRFSTLGTGWLAGACAGVLVLLVVLFLYVTTPDKPWLSKVTGALTIKRSQQALSGAAGMVLREGDLLELDPGAAATISFRQEPTLFQLTDRAQFQIESKGKGKSFRLVAGTVSAKVAPQPSHWPLRIQTALAQAEVLGTEFILSAEKEATRLDVWDGQVRLQQLSNRKEVRVGPGEFAQARDGSELEVHQIQHGVLREYWLNLSGSSIADLTSSARFPDRPSGREYLTDFEAPSNWGESYGAKLSGYLHPWVSGPYRFWISADDSAELWLSPDQDPIHKARICHSKEWTRPRDWDRRPEQASSEIFLEAGKTYYLEALHKENAGEDSVSVAWMKPKGQRELLSGGALTPAEGRER